MFSDVISGSGIFLDVAEVIADALAKQPTHCINRIVSKNLFDMARGFYSRGREWR